MPTSDTFRKSRARAAALTRHRGTDDPEVADARRAAKAASVEDYIRRVVDEAPPLTDDQRARLSRILRGDGGRHEA